MQAISFSSAGTSARCASPRRVSTADGVTGFPSGTSQRPASIRADFGKWLPRHHIFTSPRATAGQASIRELWWGYFVPLVFVLFCITASRTCSSLFLEGGQVCAGIHIQFHVLDLPFWTHLQLRLVDWGQSSGWCSRAFLSLRRRGWSGSRSFIYILIPGRRGSADHVFSPKFRLRVCLYNPLRAGGGSNGLELRRGRQRAQLSPSSSSPSSVSGRDVALAYPLSVVGEPVLQECKSTGMVVGRTTVASVASLGTRGAVV